MSAHVDLSCSPRVEIQKIRGRLLIVVDGQPLSPVAYSPTGWNPENFQKTTPWFCQAGVKLFFVALPVPIGAPEWGEELFWKGDTISSTPLWPFRFGINEQIDFILNYVPDAYFIVRNGFYCVPSWCKSHPELMVWDESKKVLNEPSLAAEEWIDCVIQHGKKIIEYCQQHDWSRRIIGYWYGWHIEGTPEYTFSHQLYDYGPAMQRRFCSFLRDRYQTVEALREAWKNPHLTFDQDLVPSHLLFGNGEQVRNLPYFQSRQENAPLRDYLLCLKECFHEAFTKVVTSLKQMTRDSALILYDCLKIPMLGWSNYGFFADHYHWNRCYYEPLAASGHIDVGPLLNLSELDGLITPYDYQHRGVGGVCEPEGCADSCILRDRIFLVELDTRTYHDDRENGAYGTAKDFREFQAVNWRNIATSLTRGYYAYWMDLVGDWFGSPEIQEVIKKSVELSNQALHWDRQEIPCIAMIIDDEAILETNGSGNLFFELIQQEWRHGLAHCGVPYRIYLWKDLYLDQFPDRHRLYYFPNFYRVSEERLSILRKKIMKNGNVLLWGPGCGISDGDTLSPDHAYRLTGFRYEMEKVNLPRYVRIHNFSHPITSNLPADCRYGCSVPYGPAIFPKDGTILGIASCKKDQGFPGLAVKKFDSWYSIVTVAGPLPAELWRSLARFSGTHVYCESNDVILADSTLLAIHSIKSEEKVLYLPKKSKVFDLLSNQPVGESLSEICFFLHAPATHCFFIENEDPVRI